MKRSLRMLLFCVTLYVAWAGDQEDCFDGDDLPSFFLKKDATGRQNDRWTAIEVDQSAKRVFLGGKFKDTADYWANNGNPAAVTYKPVAACWNVTSARYLWTKRLIDTSGHFGEVQAIGLNHNNTTLIVTGVTKTVADNKRFIYFLNAQTGTHVQDALILTLSTQIEHTNRYQIVTNVPNRLYLTGMASRTVNSGAGGFSDVMQLIAIDYSSTPHILAHYTNNDFSGSITAALTLSNTQGSERILLGAGYTHSKTNAEYDLAILQYSADTHAFKGLNFQYDQAPSVYTSSSDYQTIELMSRESSSSDYVCLTTRNRDYNHPAQNSMVAMVQFGGAQTHNWWAKWTSATQSQTRVLALTSCKSSEKYVAGVSYDDQNKHFVYWEVKFNSILYIKAYYYYSSNTFVQAAAYFDQKQIDNDNLSTDIRRCFLAGYAQGNIDFDIPSTVLSTESPMLMDSLGDEDMCYNNQPRLLDVTAVYVTIADAQMPTFLLPHTPTSSVTSVDYRLDDLVHAYKVPGTNYCIEQPDSAFNMITEFRVQVPNSFEKTFYKSGNLGIAMVCDIGSFSVNQNSCDGSSEEKNRFEYSIEYTGDSIPAQDIVHYDSVTQKLIFNVRSSLVTAATYQMKLHGSLPNGVTKSVSFTLHVVDYSGVNSCITTTPSPPPPPACEESTTQYQLSTQQNIPTQWYKLGDPQVVVLIDDFTLAPTEGGCSYENASFTLDVMGPSSSLFQLSYGYVSGPSETQNIKITFQQTNSNSDVGDNTLTLQAFMPNQGESVGSLTFTFKVTQKTCIDDTIAQLQVSQILGDQVYNVNQPRVTKNLPEYFTLSSTQYCTEADIEYSVTILPIPNSQTLFVLDQSAKTLSWGTTHPIEANQYTIQLKAALPNSYLQINFLVDIKASCFQSVDSLTLSGTCQTNDYTFTIGDEPVPIQFDPVITLSALECLESDVVYSLENQPTFVTLDSQNLAISLQDQDIYSSDVREYTFKIKGTISRQSGDVSAELCLFVLTVVEPAGNGEPAGIEESAEIEELQEPADSDICIVAETQLDVSGLTDVTYSVGTGPARFVLSLSDNVNGICWKTWSYQLFINGDSPTQITQTSTSDPKLTFDSSAHLLQVETYLPHANSLPLLLIASREDGQNFATGSFNLHFSMEANNAPYFENGYLLNSTQVNVTATQAQSFDLGASFDPENDDFTCKLNILPTQAVAYFNLDCKTGLISFERESLLALASESSDQIIQVTVVILDQNDIVPMSNKYIFSFLIAKLPPAETEEDEESSAETLDFVPSREKIEAVIERRIRFISMRPTPNGNFDLYFSEQVYNPENLTVIDPSMLRLELMSENDFTADQLAFSWQITLFTRTMMRIEITWAQPLYISALEPDTLRVTALVDAYLGFQGVSSTPDTYVTLKDGTKIECNVPRLLKGSQEDQAAFMELVQSLGQASKSAVAGGLLVNLLLASTLTLVWNLVNVLQVITHLMFMNTLLPQNAFMFNDELLAAANLDVLPMDAIYEVIFPFLYTNGVDMSRQLQEQEEKEDGENDVEDSPLAEVGNFLFSLIVLFSLVPILILVRFLGIRKNWVTKLQGLIFWSGTLQIFVESYLEITLSCFLAISIGLKWETWVDDFLSGFTYFTILTFVLAPAGISLFLSFRVSQFREKSFQQRFGSVIESLNFRRNIAPWFLSLFCYRRLLLVLLIVYMGSSGYAQIMLICQTSAIGIIVLGTINPIHLPVFRRMEFLNESMILVCIYHYFCFTTFVESPVVREQVGQSLIRAILFVLFSNVYLMATFMVRRAVFLLKMFRGYLYRKKAKLLRRSSRAKKQKTPPIQQQEENSEKSPASQHSEESSEKSPASQHSEESSEASQEFESIQVTELRRNKRRHRRESHPTQVPVLRRNKRSFRKNRNDDAFDRNDMLPNEESKQIQQETVFGLSRHSSQLLIPIPTVENYCGESSDHEWKNLSVIEEEECDFDRLQMQIDNQMEQMWSELAAFQQHQNSQQKPPQKDERNQNAAAHATDAFQWW